MTHVRKRSFWCWVESKSRRGKTRSKLSTIVYGGGDNATGENGSRARGNWCVTLSVILGLGCLGNKGYM